MNIYHEWLGGKEIKTYTDAMEAAKCAARRERDSRKIQRNGFRRDADACDAAEHRRMLANLAYAIRFDVTSQVALARRMEARRNRIESVRDKLLYGLSRLHDGTDGLRVHVDACIRDGIHDVKTAFAILAEAIEDARIERERENAK